MQCIFVFTIMQLLHNNLHTAQASFRELYVRWPFTPGSHILRLQCVCGPCAVQKQLSHRSLQLIRGCLLQTQHLSIILISNPNIVTELDFSALWFFFLHSTVIQSFIDVFKRNKYKQHIIQCFLLLHLLLDLYIKFLKQERRLLLWRKVSFLVNQWEYGWRNKSISIFISLLNVDRLSWPAVYVCTRAVMPGSRLHTVLVHDRSQIYA